MEVIVRKWAASIEKLRSPLTDLSDFFVEREKLILVLRTSPITIGYEVAGEFFGDVAVALATSTQRSAIDVELA